MNSLGITKIAKDNNLEIITTEKDYVRLSKNNYNDIKFIKVDLEISNQEKFIKEISKLYE